jgi:hypothetical protein
LNATRRLDNARAPGCNRVMVIRVRSTRTRGLMVLLPLLVACGGVHPRHLEEVPIGTNVGDEPAQGDAAAPNVPSSDAAVLVADVPQDAAVTPDPDTAPGKKKGAHGGKPTAVSGGGGESERTRLEAKVDNGTATRQDVQALLKICNKAHDKACMKHALQSQPH